MTKSEKTLFERVKKINLARITAMVAKDNGWTKAQASRHTLEYRQFLFLAATEEEKMIPTQPIDMLWHAHILHTKKYAVDCERTFGRFIHHNPMGERTKKSEPIFNALCDSMKLFQKKFGTDPVSTVLNGLKEKAEAAMKAMGWDPNITCDG